MFSKTRIVLLIFLIFYWESALQVILLKWFFGLSTYKTIGILSSLRHHDSSIRSIKPGHYSNQTINISANNQENSIIYNESIFTFHDSSQTMDGLVKESYDEFYPIIQYLTKPRNRTIVYTYQPYAGFSNRLRSIRGLLLMAMLNNASFCTKYDSFFSIMDDQLSILKCRGNINGKKWNAKYVSKRFQENPCSYVINENIHLETCYDLSDYFANCSNFKTDLKRNNNILETDDLSYYLSRFLFRPKQYIINYGNEVLSKMGGIRVGIQLRFGGNSAYSKEKYSFIDPQKTDVVINRTKKILNGIEAPFTLFLSSDSPLGSEVLCSLNMSFVTANKFRIGHTKDNNFSYLQRAVTDLYILSRCHVLIQTKLSSYGELAHVLAKPRSYYLIYNK